MGSSDIDRDIFGSDVSLGMILMAVLVMFWVLLLGVWAIQGFCCNNWMLKEHGGYDDDRSQKLLQGNEKEAVPGDPQQQEHHQIYGAL
mmetsp:Transcript_37779/g.73191  ORF Transcript_37779/g.73191 Transcript_37779/m.73191 type:complete len:88 (-) Transcript_37779:185-448(-)